jgi:hypothetical protein
MLLTGHTVFSQQACWVFFTDKNNTSFDPYTYLDAYAIDRRMKNNLSLYDTTDFPLTSLYVREVSSLSEEIIGETRWFNALAIFATEENIAKIQAFPFVKEIMPIQTSLTLCSYRELQIEEDTPVITYEFNDNIKQFSSSDQISRMDGNVFIENNIDGQGIRIAVFDAGFSQVNTHIAFEHLRKNNSIVKTWNFCNKKENVYGYHSHGRMVLSCIAGVKDAQKLGLATGAEFLLARTEIDLEIYREEVWWLMAAEWADKNGAHIINSSLGYGGDRYELSDMDGKFSLVTRAANMAASKGILVVNAAGNEGTKTAWNYSIIAPADADSILTVGGISPLTDYRINFSSRGPTADGRLKPNVVAYGVATVAKAYNHTGTSMGTSFSSPLIAGFAACAWQTNTNLTNMQLKTEIEHSADLYPYFDYDLGYGVPQASYFFEKKTTVDTNILSIVETDDIIQVFIDHSLDKEYKKKKKYINQNYIYYHIQNEKGGLVKYLVLSLPDNEKQKNDKCMVTQIESQELKQGYTLRVYYNGVLKEYSK